MIFDCPKGTVCQPKKGIKTTVECFPENPCSRIDCGSQLCRIDQVSGRGYCGIDPLHSREVFQLSVQSRD
ncbi:hypothetical protein GBAR_LOCUS21664 [Geodia barretti]|uniref:Uncharacterized protein n=1 Tax=Geodia barretti TaxID=519541 RepID=A0AA35T0B2_GEOBA|nr:hypothetical protein GBAR_LOCUS21664 [Geodia barretti]